MGRWLLKSDPDTYSFHDLARDRTTVWDGVTNPVALKNIRAMKHGDDAFVYHTGKERAIVGLATIASDPYPDPKDATGRLVVMKLEARGPLARPVTLEEMKGARALAGWDLFRLGRLSIVPVTDAQWKAVMAMAARKA
ncbi:MAG: EVE domain-containing protein [Acidobacteriota bacterium]